MPPPSDASATSAGNAWRSVLEALPPLTGLTVVDAGCGEGVQAAELAVRGARVVGLDFNPDLLRSARARNLPGATFLEVDLRQPLPLDEDFDGLWCSYAAAYFPDLAAVLRSWTARLRPGGFVALLEIDDLFGHEPVSPRTRSLLEAYAASALRAGRYDFHMGRKLCTHAERAGLAVRRTWALADDELCFDGAAPPAVLETWRARLDRMTLLREFCGEDFDDACRDLLEGLARPDHRSLATVCACLATR